MILERHGSPYDRIVGTALNAAMTGIGAVVTTPERAVGWVARHRLLVATLLAGAAVAAAAVVVAALHAHTTPAPLAPVVSASALTSTSVCWTEVDGERVCGDRKLAPSGSAFDARYADREV